MDSVERTFSRALHHAVDHFLERRRGPGELSIRVPRAVNLSQGTQRMWLTVEETVLYLGLPSRRALYQAVRRGHFPVHRLGRLLRFRRSELDEALAER